MVYKTLLLSEGGGITSIAQLTKPNPTEANIFIGLGGTGIDAMMEIRKAVYERIEPDDPTKAVKEFDKIRFLAIDTDVNGMKSLELNQEEIYAISSVNASPILQSNHSLGLHSHYYWFNPEVLKLPAPTLNGAGGIRQYGRAYVMAHATQIKNTIQTAITKASSNQSGSQSVVKTVNIHILSGIGGGTGSGTFLDICYLVRSITSGNNTNVFGYVFLPDVNLSKIPDAQGTTRNGIQRNGYAALQELDYCMRITENGGAFTQDYGNGQRIAWNQTPMDLCHLIGAQTMAGTVIKDAYRYAMSATREYILRFLTDSKEESFSIQSHQSNISNSITDLLSQLKAGHNINYCALGGASSAVPMREINTYLACGIFNNFVTPPYNVREKKPDSSAVTNFLNAMGLLTFDQIEDGMLKSEICTGIPETTIKTDTLYDHCKDYPQDMNHGNFVQHYRDQLNDRINEQLIPRYNNLVGANGVNQATYIAKIHAEMVKMIKDIDRGVFYAYDILNGTGHGTQNVLNILAGHLSMAGDKKAQAQRDYSYNRGLFKQAYEEFATYKWKLIGGTSKQKLREKMEGLYRGMKGYELEFTFYEKVESAISIVMKQIDAMVNKCYVPIRTIVRDLFNTFEENSSFLGTRMGSDLYNDGFTTPMVTIGQLQSQLDQAIKAHENNLPRLFQTLMTTSVDHGDKLTDFLLSVNGKDVSDYLVEVDTFVEKEEELSHRLVELFTAQFDVYANKTIDQYLADICGTSDPNQIAEHVVKNVLTPTDQFASPLFPTKNLNINQSKVLTIPANVASLSQAANKFMPISNSVNETSISDRIYIGTYTLGMALVDYDKLEACANQYYRSASPGVHYYEAHSRNTERDWKKLGALKPASTFAPDEPLWDVAHIRETKSLYDDALKYQLINNKMLYKLADTVRDNLQALIVQYEQNKGNIANVSSFVASLEAELNRPLTPTEYGFLINVNNPTDEANIQYDYFMISPIFQEVVRPDVELLRQVSQIQDDLAEEMRKQMALVQEMTDFATALFYGLIKQNNYRVELTYLDEFGINATHYQLCDNKLENYPYYDLALYQAFKSYQDIVHNDIEKQNIMAAIQRAQTEGITLEMKTTWKSFNEEVELNKSTNLLKMALQNSRILQSQTGEVISLYKHVYKNISHYININNLAVQ